MNDLAELADYLVAQPAVAEKAHIHRAFEPAFEISSNIRLGDDCAAIPNPGGHGHLLFAAEGMLGAFVEEDPWFAGYAAVMINLSDVAAMGGRPIAITDVMWTPSDEISKTIWQGIQAAFEVDRLLIAEGVARRADIAAVGHDLGIGIGHAALQ